ncbi:MAG: hypothetical protein J0M24_00325 [Verrucomicrobia bacterium]|nr:hypothetical protein [Verrucomicrobiota bacterium]
MKPRLIPLTVAAGLLFAATDHGWALPPLQHSVSGVIKAINYDAHTIKLDTDKGDQPLTFVWKDYTRFSQGWSRICLGALEPGQSVRIWYRRQVGQLVPREVSLPTKTATRCTSGGCCAKGS